MQIDRGTGWLIGINMTLTVKRKFHSVFNETLKPNFIIRNISKILIFISCSSRRFFDRELVSGSIEYENWGFMDPWIRRVENFA